MHGCLLASFNLASRGINGDFFDLFEFDDGCFDLLVGDAMGKGVPAALLGAALKMQFSRSIAELVAHGEPGAERPSPARIVAHSQRAMHARLQALDSFVTLCYLRIDRVRGTATWVGCGHEETMLFHGNAPPEFLRNQHPPLGVIEEAEIFEDSVRLGPGDTVVLYSDGLTDAVDDTGERFGLDRLAATLRALVPTHRRPGTIVRGMRAAVEAFTNRARIPDDMTMLVLQLPDGEPNTRRERLDMPRTLSQLQTLRNFVAMHAAAGLGDDDAASLALAAVELASNVVRHDSRPGDGPIEVVCTTGPELATLRIRLRRPALHAAAGAEARFLGRIGRRLRPVHHSRELRHRQPRPRQRHQSRHPDQAPPHPSSLNQPGSSPQTIGATRADRWHNRGSRPAPPGETRAPARSRARRGIRPSGEARRLQFCHDSRPDSR